MTPSPENAGDSPEQLYALWREAVAHSCSVVAEALGDGDPERLGRSTASRGQSPSLRYIVITLIEEHARHVGHANFIRESVDGLTGEDPPV
jgi:Protein of unknown function (DUF664)